LLEILLAIALSATVVWMVTTAVELFLIRSEAGRVRVETAQVARAVLDQMAADLAAVRFSMPSPTLMSSGPLGGSGAGAGGPGTGGTGAGGPAAGGPAGGGSPGSSGSGLPGGSGGTAGPGAAAPSSAPPVAHGIVGTAQVIRIDRGSIADWTAEPESPAGESAAAAPPNARDFPATVRYEFRTGDWQSAADSAAEGVAEIPRTEQSGLYRERLPSPTAALSTDTASSSPLPSTGTGSASGGPAAAQSGPAGGSMTGPASSGGDQTSTEFAAEAPPPSLGPQARVELLAPEVVGLELAYFDGEEFVESWDSSVARRLPAGVEIRLRLALPRLNSSEPPTVEEQVRLAEGRFREDEIVEFRRFVRLSAVSPPRPALPIPVSGGGGAFGAMPGSPGQGGPGQGGSGPSGSQPAGGTGGGPPS
jgi:hypothetical protein